MAGYVITGTRGAGKSLVAVARLREYIDAGKPVATNIDLDLGKLLRSPPRAQVIRMPDRPLAEDFEALPTVHDTGVEDRNGAIVLDECAVWLNAREWNGGDRQRVIDWLLHSRKRGWDLFFIVQDIGLLDKQARTTLFDYRVTCKRLDRLKIPFLGKLLKLFSFGMLSGNMPKVHMGVVSYGFGPGAPHADTWVYRATDLYAAYRTGQIMTASRDAGNHCLLVPPPPRPAPRTDLKPKLPHVERLMALPADARIAALRLIQDQGRQLARLTPHGGPQGPDHSIRSLAVQALGRGMRAADSCAAGAAARSAA